MTNDNNHQKDTSNHIAEEAGKASDTIKKEAGQLADEAKETSRQQAEKQFEKGQNVVAAQVDTLSSAVDEAASKLNEEDHPLGHYTREIADSMSGLSERISNSSLDELAHDTRKLARENPGLFLLGSIAIGVAASRFFKASANRDSREYMGSDMDRGESHAQNYGRSTSVRHTSPYSGMDRHAVSARTPGSHDAGTLGNTNVGGSASPSSTDTAQNRPRTNSPVSPTEKSATLKSVEESEGA